MRQELAIPSTYPKESGKATVGAYVRAASGTIKDTVFRFLGLNVGTPLQRKLSKLALILFAIAVLFAIIVLAANKFSNNSEVIIYAVATALSMIPASLVVVLTITMSMGTKRMVKRNVIVRNMNASENLGAVTNICTDKTGTITQGKIVAKRAYIPAYGAFTVDDIRNSNHPSDGSTTFSSLSPVEADTRVHDDNGAEPTKVSDVTTHTHVPAFESFLRVASLCNLAAVFASRFQFSREAQLVPTAAQTTAASSSETVTASTDLEKQWVQFAEFPFDSDVKRMSVVFRRLSGESDVVFMKGAVERILNACTTSRTKEGDVMITEQHKTDVLGNMEVLSGEGLGVLALALRDWTEAVEEWRGYPRENVEQDMTFLGLIGLYDQPRPESYEKALKTAVLHRPSQSRPEGASK
ncbi:hypothetical protein FRC05_011093 [Tulasnella sp. 425]|nr:hypothetical protein FRC05_011093 [Tulasnella sp. 425]